MTKLFLNRRMFLCYSNYLRPAYDRRTLFGIRHTPVPNASTQNLIEIQDTSGNT